MVPEKSADAAYTPDQALTRLYAEHFRPLLRLATLLVQDSAAAEEITEAAFAATHDAWQRLKDTRTAVAYLRRDIVSRARIVRRHQAGSEGSTPIPADISLAQQPAGPGFKRASVMAMLRSMPDRQRETLVLRYYCDLPEAQAAAAIGVSRAALKRHAARGMAAVRMILEQESRRGRCH